MTDTSLLEAALGYAARGWPVFPVNPRTKVPLVKADVGEDGRKIHRSGGIAKATTDAATVTAWWTKWPKAMIAAAMGPAAGVFALDFDPRHDDDTGEVWTVAELIARTEAVIGCPLPATARSRSPSGGEHWFYRWPTSGPPITTRDALPEKVDVRGLGGGCTLAPSVRADGAYEWLAGLDDLADAPAGLLAVLQRPPPARLVPREREVRGEVDAAVVAAVETYALKGLQAECRLVADAASGGRNPQLNKSAFAVAGLVAATLSNGASVLLGPMARATLLEAALGNPGRDDRSQIEATLDSGWSAGLAQPRDLGQVEAEARARLDRQRGPGPRGSPGSHGQYRGSAGHAGAQPPRAGAPRADATLAPDGAAAPPDDPPPPSASPAPPAPSVAVEKRSSQMGGSRLPPTQRGSGECDDAGIMRPQTDLGNAERWLLRHGHAFRYCPTLGWLAWDTRRWSRDDADRLLAESVYATVRSIQDEAAACRAAGIAWREPRWASVHPGGFDPTIELCDPADDTVANPDPWVRTPKTGRWLRRSDLHAAFGRSSEGERAIKAIVKLIVPYVSIRLECFDADPMKFNVANGTLRFSRTLHDGLWLAAAELRPHAPDDLITMLADIVYDPAAASPVYDGFLARVQPDPAVRDFLHAYAGYSLTGDTSEQALVINHGALGGNGKSTWINIVAVVMGEYSISVPIEVFLDSGRTRSASGPSPDIARLPRRRLVRTAEPPRDAPFAEALLKLLSGDDTITARHLNLPFFEFVPEFKMVVTMNPSPKLSSDPAIWRRTNIVPWLVSMTNAPDRDPDLPVKLRRETPGILNRLVEGLKLWLEHGLPKVDAIVAATTAQRERSDPLGQFLATATSFGREGIVDPDPKVRVGVRHLFAVFTAWAEWAAAIGGKPWSEKGFSAAMVDKGFEPVKSSTMWFVGITATMTVDDFINPVTGKPWTNIGGEASRGAGDGDPGPDPPDMGRSAGG